MPDYFPDDFHVPISDFHSHTKFTHIHIRQILADILIKAFTRTIQSARIMQCIQRQHPPYIQYEIQPVCILNCTEHIGKNQTSTTENSNHHPTVKYNGMRAYRQRTTLLHLGHLG